MKKTLFVSALMLAFAVSTVSFAQEAKKVSKSEACATGTSSAMASGCCEMGKSVKMAKSEKKSEKKSAAKKEIKLATAQK
ncbi:MAG: hypothetical protein IAF08_02330 [Rhizobacter sp.]|nr:hypothetical protein [Chlorobiales bacterium]